MSVIAVTGATGYIGGRLVPLLLEQGHTVRILTRRSNALRDVPWRGKVHVVVGDLSDPQAVKELCTCATFLYYLAHLMADNKDFAPVEEHCARIVAAAANKEGIARLI